jgi:hypothetical protein
MIQQGPVLLGLGYESERIQGTGDETLAFLLHLALCRKLTDSAMKNLSMRANELQVRNAEQKSENRTAMTIMFFNVEEEALGHCGWVVDGG